MLCLTEKLVLESVCKDPHMTHQERADDLKRARAWVTQVGQRLERKGFLSVRRGPSGKALPRCIKILKMPPPELMQAA